jgi:glycosyltransferase involved in cell wall biosynthesis
MLAGNRTPTAPLVSIILPTYNRAGFLAEAFAAIRGQSFADWELIVVDDGSKDATRDVVAQLANGLTQQVRYLHQENQGAYGARNTGLDHTRCRHIAFYDSDDLWLPHHLRDCVEALEANPDVDWVYSASQLVDHSSGRVLAPSSFHIQGEPKPFLRLRTRSVGGLKVIDDPLAVERALSDGLGAGLQVSVMRRSLFEGFRFEATSRNEAEDQLLAIHALVAGRRMAYFEDVHLVYRVHGGNSSATGTQSPDKHVRVFQALAEGYERLRNQVRFTPAQTQALNHRISKEYFWHLGYQLLRHPGWEREALSFLWRGLWLWPTSLGLWKAYLVAWLRVKSGLLPHGTPQPAQGA